MITLENNMVRYTMTEFNERFGYIDKQEDAREKCRECDKALADSLDYNYSYDGDKFCCRDCLTSYYDFSDLIDEVESYRI